MADSGMRPQTKETIGQLLGLVLVDLFTGKARHQFWMRIFLILGVLMVCFSEAFSQVLVPKDQHGGYFSDQAQEIATTLRFLGVMVFNAGLVERVIVILHERNGNTS